MPDQPQFPFEGQHFTLNPVQPKPKPSMSWGIPLSIGLLAIPLLMFGFGFSQQQQPAAPTPSPSATPEAQPSPVASADPMEALTAQPVTPQSVAPTPPNDRLIDAATLPTATIRAIDVAANFRAAPSLHSPVLGVLMNGDLVQLTTDRRVLQDGVTWVPVRYRGQSGWIAQNFIGGQTNAGI